MRFSADVQDMMREIGSCRSRISELEDEIADFIGCAKDYIEAEILAAGLDWKLSKVTSGAVTLTAAADIGAEEAGIIKYTIDTMHYSEFAQRLTMHLSHDKLHELISQGLRVSAWHDEIIKSRTVLY